MEDPFTHHLFLKDMKQGVHLPAKWYRRWVSGGGSGVVFWWCFLFGVFCIALNSLINIAYSLFVFVPIYNSVQFRISILFAFLFSPRLRIELGTMPESLPNNVIVFTGVGELWGVLCVILYVKMLNLLFLEYVSFEIYVHNHIFIRKVCS
jgi:hypothetical protein